MSERDYTPGGMTRWLSDSMNWLQILAVMENSFSTQQKAKEVFGDTFQVEIFPQLEGNAG